MVRVKNRYLVLNFLYPTATTTTNSKDALPEFLQFHQPTPDEFTSGKLFRAIQDGVMEMFGDYGAGMVGTSLKVNYHSTATSTSIVRCPTAHYEMVWAALTHMTSLPRPMNTPVIVTVVRVTGTIRKAEEEIIRRAKEIILRSRLAEDGSEDVAIIKSIIEKRGKDGVMDVDQEDDGSEASESE